MQPRAVDHLCAGPILSFVEPFWAGMIGAVVGGLFTLLGAWLQSRAALRVALAQAETVAAHAQRQRELDVLHNAHLDLLRVLRSGWPDLDTPAEHEFGKRVEATLRTYEPFLDTEIVDTVTEMINATPLYQDHDPEAAFEAYERASDLLQRALVKLASKSPSADR